jgi:hypothetical protein
VAYTLLRTADYKCIYDKPINYQFVSKSIGKSSQSRTAPADDPDLNPLAFLIDVVGLVGVVQYVRISVQFLTLRVGDDLLDGVVEDFRNPFTFSRSPPSFGYSQFAFVLVVGFRRRQTNGRDGLGELDGRLQRQDGDVVGLICLTIISVIIDQWIINWHSSIQLYT